jgi:Zn/Cd-binding protein ZinT
MERREFIKSIAVATGIAITDIEKGLSKVITLFDEKKNQWLYTQTIKLSDDIIYPEKQYVFSCWIKVEGEAWRKVEQVVNLINNKIEIKIPVPKERADIVHPILEILG